MSHIACQQPIVLVNMHCFVTRRERPNGDVEEEALQEEECPPHVMCLNCTSRARPEYGSPYMIPFLRSSFPTPLLCLHCLRCQDGIYEELGVLDDEQNAEVTRRMAQRGTAVHRWVPGLSGSFTMQRWVVNHKHMCYESHAPCV